MAGKKSSGVSSMEPLCCCEYQNESGERSHILACCCDCQALDQTCDKLLTCQRVPTSTIDHLLSTLSDRCRFPGLAGKGAIKMRLDVVTPVLVVPLSLLFACLGPVATVIAFAAMPAFLLLFHQLWRRQSHSRRTRFFMVWGLTSVLFCLLVFLAVVVSFREILLWEILLQLSSTMALLYAFYRTKGDPGILRSGEGTLVRKAVKPSSTNTSTTMLDGATNSSQVANGGVLYDHASGQAVTQGRSLYDHTDTAIEVEGHGRGSAGEIDASAVRWIDSRPIREGKLVTWCSSCSFRRPPRAGHCTVCDACIAVRDHHCVWIDQCVGGANHRWFMAAMLLFVWCGCYGCHLTFTTICTPAMVYDWFLVPSDCRFLYQNFYTSMSFVCAAYTLMATALMACNLVYQVALISQNLTSQELHTALSRGGRLVRCGFFPSQEANPNYHGVLRNWLEFLLLPVRSSSSKIPS